MEFTVSEEIFQKFPNARVGVVIATGIENIGSDEAIDRMLTEAQAETKAKFNIENLAEHSSIAVWREAYSSFGSKPREFRSSIEALIRSVLNGRGVRHINKLVDIYNYVSLKHAIPVGGEDIDKTSGNLYLKFSDGSESFTPLGSDKQDNPYKGEVIYRDDGGNVLCRRWNWRESDVTKLTEDTKNAIIVAEGFDESIGLAIGELKSLIEKFCSAKCRPFLVDKTNRKAKW